MRVLTWNLFHGRSVPDVPGPLLHAFARRLAGWEWDVALLQEVPPWWPVPLARATGAVERSVRTSRNQLLPLRRAVAARRPDIMKANGGGANVILVRGATVVAHRARRLRIVPERRLVHAVRLGDGRWIANLHAQSHPHARTRADVALAGAAVLAWAGGAPALLGGDFNVPDPAVPGFEDAGGHGMDRVLVRGLRPRGPARTLPRHGLSDHEPVLVTVADN